MSTAYCYTLFKLRHYIAEKLSSGHHFYILFFSRNKLRVIIMYGSRIYKQVYIITDVLTFLPYKYFYTSVLKILCPVISLCIRAAHFKVLFKKYSCKSAHTYTTYTAKIYVLYIIKFNIFQKMPPKFTLFSYFFLSYTITKGTKYL